MRSCSSSLKMFSAARVPILRQAQSHLRPSRISNGQRQLALARLLSSLAVLEQREGELNNASLSAVTAAQELDGPITGFIAGTGAKSVAEEAAKVKGLKKIIFIENSSYDKVRPHVGSSGLFLNICYRASLRITLLCSPKTSKGRASAMYSLATQPSARTSCRELQHF